MEQKLMENGIESVEELATKEAAPLTRIKGIRINRAEELTNTAKNYLDEVWENRQWDPASQEWYDAGKSYYECICGFRHGSETTFKAHQNRCQVYMNAEELQCEDCEVKFTIKDSDTITLSEGDYCPNCGHLIGTELEKEVEGST